MTLRILSYNIHKGFDLLGRTFVLRQLKQALQQTQADIVLLQEVVGENKNLQQKISDWPLQSQFEFLADSVWPHYSYGKNAVFSGRNHGNAILSRFPISSWSNLDLSNHKLERRGLLQVELTVPERGQRLSVFNVHLDLTARGRQKQMEKIISAVEANIGMSRPFILGGDFNDWGQQITPHLEKHHIQEAFLTLSGGHARSFPSFFPLLHLDRIYFRALKPTKAQVLFEQPWTHLSDHLPILAELEWP